MSQQGWPRNPRNPRSGQQDDWWSQLYDPGSPDTGSSRSGDTLDDRYASVRRTMGQGTGSGRATEKRSTQPEPEPGGRPESGGRPEYGGQPQAPEGELQPDDGAETRAEPERDGGSAGAAPERDPGTFPGPDSGSGPGPLPVEEPPPDPRTDGTFSRQPPHVPQSPHVPQPPQEPSASPLPNAEPAAAEPPISELAGPAAYLTDGPGATPYDGGDGPTADSRGPAAPGSASPEASGEALDETSGEASGPGGVPLRPDHVGDRPPTYEAEPATFPAADAASLSELVPDTVLDGAHYGGLTLRAASLRGDSARHRGALRRDALLTARFGSGESALLLVAVAAGGRAATGGHRAAREICQSIGSVVGRSHARLAEDIRADRRGALKSGLQRLTERCYGKLRAQAAALDMRPEEYTADLRCLLLSADPRCRTRVFFGAGAGGLFRLRSGQWQDIENDPGAEGLPGVQGGGLPGQGAGDSGTDSALEVDTLDPSELGDPAALSVPVGRAEPRQQRADRQPRGSTPPGGPGFTGGPGPGSGSSASPASPGARSASVPASAPGSAGTAGPSAAPAPGGSPLPPVPPPVRPEPERFRFRAAVAQRGDTLLLCSPGLAEPLRAEPAFAWRLAQSWSWSERTEPPGLAAFLADVQLRVRGFADDRTAVAVWEA
ncbi:protein phosphatase 2C domain-containing protein [Streptomyces marispadix]|uniref:Protein phosphatase 2C domain-containing protein n=1 Tax=Streptomyces marispadix TaxID=2922868 RepID=A0ABS9T3Z8_9ACTN|nr:protein phosphatase 2C domain-containing protein [Streptomyces marispadix]MCH6163259.1 protein phosphatase 2C domain-containing protein [Streptomyces marispadix]